MSRRLSTRPRNPGSSTRSIPRRAFLDRLLRGVAAALALGGRFPGVGFAQIGEPTPPFGIESEDPLVLRRRPRRPAHEFAPFPVFTETEIYGVGTYRAGPPELLATALARGVALIDTSPDYRGGKAESEIGSALAPGGRPVFLMTQIPVDAWDRRNRKEAFHRALKQSLGRLRRHQVEALLVRNAEAWQVDDPQFREFAREVKESGLVKHLGASGHAPDLEKVLERGLEDDLLEVFLVGAHLAGFERMPSLLAAARDRGKILVAMKSREAALWNHGPGWEREAERRRHAPWDDRWDARFTRDGLASALAATGAGNAVLSLRHPEDLEAIARA